MCTVRTLRFCIFILGALPPDVISSPLLLSHNSCPTPDGNYILSLSLLVEKNENSSFLPTHSLVPAFSFCFVFHQKLEDTTEDLRDCLFSLAFVDESPKDEGSIEGPMGRRNRRNGGKVTCDSQEVPIGETTSHRNPIEPVVNLGTPGDSLHTAIRACETARAKLREEGHKQQTVQR